ncbi:MAG: hypothetical protein EXR43_01770 [Dehalococcoidia bacterium]|nr:hypothetical protein [Dehalococcoidia bacterium]
MSGALLAWGALLRRDLREFSRSRSQLGSSLLLPLMLLAILGTGVSSGLDPQKVRDSDYTSYLAPGLIAMTALFSSTFAGASFYQDRDSGILKVLLTSPHSQRSIMFGKALGSVAIGSIQATIVLLLAIALPTIDLQWQYGVAQGVLLAVGAVLLMNVMLAGIAQAFASRIATMHGFHLLMNLVLFPLLFFSGAFFPLVDLPWWLRLLGAVNPVTYPVDLLHLAIYAESGSGYYGLAIDLPVLAVLAVLMFALGVRSGAFRRNLR